MWQDPREGKGAPGAGCGCRRTGAGESGREAVHGAVLAVER